MEEIQLKKVLASGGFTFKKQYGQNFINEAALLDKIAELSGADKSCEVIEIGCGAGTLTRKLAERAAFVHAYEIDKSLQPVLAQTLSGFENVEVIFKDFLKLRLDEIEKNLPEYRVAANLPYYITTPLIMMLLEHGKKCLSITAMVQREVALRLCAKAGTADYGAITANVALYGGCKKLLDVPRENFYPVPNVDSAVIRIDIEENRLGDVDKTAYRKVVQAAFSARRKTLENNLCRAFSLTRAEAAAVLEKIGADEKTRGEKLSPEDFVALTKALDGHIK